MRPDIVVQVFMSEGTAPVEHRMTKLPFTIGRNPGNDIRVASKYVSGKHAQIEEVARELYVRDLGSTNGTHVASRGQRTRIAKRASYRLAHCDGEFFLGGRHRVKVMGLDLGFEEPEERIPDLRHRGAPPPDMGHAEQELPSLPGAVGGRARRAQPVEDEWGSIAHQEPGPPMSLPLPPGAGGMAGRSVAAGSFGGLPDVSFGARPSDFEASMYHAGGVGGGDGHLATQNLQVSMDTLALQGLRELVGSLLPGQKLQTSGDVARLITRLHDSVAAAARGYAELRRAYARFAEQLGLPQARGGVSAARDPGQLAARLLDFRERSTNCSPELEQGFHELAEHQIAMIDGVVAGVQALLEEISPATIERQAEGGRRGLSFSGPHKQLWEAYQARHAQLADEREIVAHVFGEDFAEAYRAYRRR